MPVREERAEAASDFVSSNKFQTIRKVVFFVFLFYSKINMRMIKTYNIINSEKQLPSIVKKIINQIKQIFAPKNT